MSIQIVQVCLDQFVLIDVRVLTRLVQHKVFIDAKGSLYWTILVYLSLNLLLI